MNTQETVRKTNKAILTFMYMLYISLSSEQNGGEDEGNLQKERKQ
jgi:hypothetical protein